MPNRFTRESQSGYEDFGAFCDLAARLGRPVTHMVRGHDHVEDRYPVHPAYQAPSDTDDGGAVARPAVRGVRPRERVPTIARFIEGASPQMHRLHIPVDIVDAVFPEVILPGKIGETVNEAGPR